MASSGGVALTAQASLWKNRSFLRLWLAQITSNIGDQFYGIALLWYLLQQTKSATALSLIPIPDMVAGFLFYLIGGVLADRYSPRLLMVSADAARLLVVLAVGSMVIAGMDEILFFLAAQFVLGIFSTLFFPAKTVALKATVPEGQLSQANAILDTTFRTIRILAPMSIGLFAASMPIAALFFVNAGSYLLSALFVYSIGGQLRTGSESAGGRLPAAQYVRDIGSACREVAGKRHLLYILLFGNIGFLVWQLCWSVGFPVLADQMGGGDAGMLGVLVGFYGAGNLLGSLFMARFSYQNHLLVILTGWLFQSVGFLALSLGGEYPYLAFASASMAGIGGPLIGIPQTTAIQTKVENVNTGKVFALNMLTFTFFCVLSSSLGVFWLGAWPVERLFLASGLFLAAAVAAGLWLDRRERQKRMEQEQFFSA
jgi:DHA3 family macrolide efflux protein-like MFS transporter